MRPNPTLAYKRSHVPDGQTLVETNPLFIEYLYRFDLKVDSVIKEVVESGRRTRPRWAFLIIATAYDQKQALKHWQIDLSECRKGLRRPLQY